MRVYISGPINTDVPNTTLEQRKDMFYKIEDALRAAGHDPVNPLRVTAECGDTCGASFEGHDWECWLKYDLIAMLKCEAICLLPGWTMSRGARLEQKIAEELHFEPFFTDTTGRIY